MSESSTREINELEEFVDSTSSDESPETESPSEEDEIAQSAGRLVTDVEVEMQNRVEKARESARNTALNENESDTKHKAFWSPPIQGATFHNRISWRETVEFEFTSELPNGRDSIKVPMPSEDEIDDEGHKMNRLLNFYGISPERISDISGKRLPLRPKGHPEHDPNDMEYILDYPPISTVANNCVYRTRRLCERLGLLRWGHTPDRVKRTFGSGVKRIDYNCSTYAPAISKVAYPFAFCFNKWDTETTVVTERGVAVFSTLIALVGLFIFYFGVTLGGVGLALISTLTSALIFYFAFGLLSYGLWYWSIRAASQTWNRLFPTTE